MYDMNGNILTNSSYMATVLFLPAKTHDSQVAAIPIDLESWDPEFGQMCSALTSHVERMICRELQNKVLNPASASMKAGGSLLFWNS